MPESIFAVAFGQRRVCQIGLDCLAQGFAVASRNRCPGAIHDHFRIGARIAGDDRRLRRHGFKRRQSETFIARRCNIKRQATIPDTDIRHFPRMRIRSCRPAAAIFAFKASSKDWCSAVVRPVMIAVQSGYFGRSAIIASTKDPFPWRNARGRNSRPHIFRAGPTPRNCPRHRQADGTAAGPHHA